MLKNLLKAESLRKWYLDLSQDGLLSEHVTKLGGIDIKDDYLCFKIYIELYTFPTEQIITKYLTSKLITEIQGIQPYWDPARESGLGLGYKIDAAQERRYFHVKFNSKFSGGIPNKNISYLKILGIDFSTLLKGISYEIRTDETFYKKHYFYIKDPPSIKKVLLYHKIGDTLDLSNIEELEMYSTETKTKVNIINNNDNYQIKQNVWTSVPAKYVNTVKQCEEILNSNLLYTGTTSDGVFSSYFCLTKKQYNL